MTNENLTVTTQVSTEKNNEQAKTLSPIPSKGIFYLQSVVYLDFKKCRLALVREMTTYIGS